MAALLAYSSWMAGPIARACPRRCETKDHSTGIISDEMYRARIQSRVMFELVRARRPAESGGIRLIYPVARKTRFASHPVPESPSDPWMCGSQRSVLIENVDLQHTR